MALLPESLLAHAREARGKARFRSKCHLRHPGRASMTLTPWLREHLVNSGAMTRDGLTRAARGRYCTTCGELTVVALAGEVAALPVVTDPLPLSPLGEALALLADRPTFSLRRFGGRLELELRNSFDMATPAGTGRGDVLAGHQCGADPLPSTTSNLPAPPTRKAHTSCPF